MGNENMVDSLKVDPKFSELHLSSLSTIDQKMSISALNVLTGRISSGSWYSRSTTQYGD